ncbi:unnamed protein product, partial [Brachionus calyciflorus]
MLNHIGYDYRIAGALINRYFDRLSSDKEYGARLDNFFYQKFIDFCDDLNFEEESTFKKSRSKKQKGFDESDFQESDKEEIDLSIQEKLNISKDKLESSEFQTILFTNLVFNEFTNRTPSNGGIFYVYFYAYSECKCGRKHNFEGETISLIKDKNQVNISIQKAICHNQNCESIIDEGCEFLYVPPFTVIENNFNHQIK